MKITEKFKNKKPVISFEIFPPKKDDALKNVDQTLEILSSLNPDYISVTFGAGGSANKNKTIELARRIKEVYHIEPMIHLTSLHYDEEEIHHFTKTLEEHGLYNILALRGDKSDLVPEKDRYHYASDLIEDLKKDDRFCVAGACYPESHPESEDRIKDLHNLKRKVDAGAEFLISQMFFDNLMYYDFVEATRIAGINVPIAAGIMPVINKRQIERMVSLCGATLPEKFRHMLTKFEHNKEALFDVGMAYATSQIVDLLVNDVDGIHLYTMNNPVVAERITNAIKNVIV